MRHLWSLLVGIVVAPLAWLTMSIGQVGTAKEFETYANKGVFVGGDFARPLALLVLAGLLIGAIACLRISPVGPLVVGVGFLAAYAGLLVSPHRTYDLFAYTFRLSFLHGQGKGDLTAPLSTGTAPLVGALLVVAVVSAKRWRRWPVALGAHSIAAKDIEGRATAPDEHGTAAASSNTPVDAPALSGEPAHAATAESTTTLPVRSLAAGTPAEPEPAGTVVWTREPSAETTESLSTAGRGRSPWDTPPGENADSSQTP